MNKIVDPAWRAIGKSLKGSRHTQNSLPNQDAIAWAAAPGGGLPLILAVADGHGSERYFRSQRGSHLAVQTALQVLPEFLRAMPLADDLNQVEQLAAELLPQSLLTAWEKKVRADLSANPFREDELAPLIDKRGPGARVRLEAEPLAAYGSTLVVAAVTERFLLYVQIGDGDILAVDAYGQTTRIFPQDESHNQNETNSLCMLNPADFHVTVTPLDANAPVLILAFTDGCTNAYQDEASLLGLGPDFLQALRMEGIETVAHNMDKMLRYLSDTANGDDISLGLIKRSEMLDADVLKQRFTALDEQLKLLETEIAQGGAGQNELQRQFEQVRAQVTGLLDRVDKTSQENDEVREKLRTLDDLVSASRLGPEMDRRMSMAESHQIASDARMAKLEQAFQELRGALEAWNSDIHRTLSELRNDAWKDQARQLDERLAIERQRMALLQDQLHQQDEALGEMEDRQTTQQQQIKLMQVALMILTGVSILAIILGCLY